MPRYATHAPGERKEVANPPTVKDKALTHLRMARGPVNRLALMFAIGASVRPKSYQRKMDELVAEGKIKDTPEGYVFIKF